MARGLGSLPAKVMVPCSGITAGVCEYGRKGDRRTGYFVRYRNTGGSGRDLRGTEAIVELFVDDLNSTHTKHVPFLIDTGADRTLIGRGLLPRGAFPPSRAVRTHDVIVEGLFDWTRPGKLFSCTIAVPPPDERFEALTFGRLEVAVVENWPRDYALLGLDALKRIVLVADQEHVCLWPP